MCIIAAALLQHCERTDEQLYFRIWNRECLMSGSPAAVVVAKQAGEEGRQTLHLETNNARCCLQMMLLVVRP